MWEKPQIRVLRSPIQREMCSMIMRQRLQSFQTTAAVRNLSRLWKMDREKSSVIRKPLSHQTFYYAVKLNDGRILRLAKTTDSVFHTLLSSFIWLGLLMLLIILVEIVLVQRQTKKSDRADEQPGSGASPFECVLRRTPPLA